MARYPVSARVLQSCLDPAPLRMSDMHHDPHTYLLPFRLAIWLGLFASGTGLVCIIYGVATHMSTGLSDPDWMTTGERR